MGVIDLYLKFQRARGKKMSAEPVPYHDLLSAPSRVAVLFSADPRVPPAAFPALQLLRRNHPGMKILAVAGPGNVGSIRREQLADKSLVFHHRGGTKQLGEIRRVAKEIEKLSPEILLLFDPEGDEALGALAYSCNVPLRIGFGRGENFPVLNFQVAPPEDTTYLAVSLLKMIGALTGEFPDFLDDSVRLRVSEHDARRAERLLHFWQPRADKLLFAVEAGPERDGGAPAIEKFAAAARLLVRAYPSRIMVLSTPEERPAAEKLEQALAPLEPYRAPAEDLAQAVAFLSRADLLVTSNTALYHYAVAIGVPAVGLFQNDTRPWWTPPGGARATTISIDKELSEEKFLNAVDSVGAEEEREEPEA